MNSQKQFCTFYLEDRFFGVPVEDVQEVFRYQEMAQVPLAPSIVRGLINLRGQIITAIDLRRRLKMKDLPEDQKPMNVVIRTDNDVVSLLVDRIGDVLEVDEESLEPPPETLDNVARQLIPGVYKLKDALLLTIDTKKTLNISS
jgi:purine-binding chemotaxis protein CheW